VKLLSNPRLANVTALLALVVALGGTGYAAASLPKGSVGAKQLKNGAVNAAKVKDGSLTTADIAAGSLAGLKGPKGDPGTPADTSTIYTKTAADARYLRGTQTVLKTASVNNANFAVARVDCPAGSQAVSGGVDNFNVLTMQVTSSGPVVNNVRTLGLANGTYPAATGWQASVANNSGATATFVVSVVCAPIG
jgi:hypothetical protein